MIVQISKFDREETCQMVEAFLPDREVWNLVTIVIPESRPKPKLTFIWSVTSMKL